MAVFRAHDFLNRIRSAGANLASPGPRAFCRGWLCGALLLTLWQPGVSSSAERATSSLSYSLALGMGLVLGGLFHQLRIWRIDWGWLILAVSAVGMPLWVGTWVHGLRFWMIDTAAFQLWCGLIAGLSITIPAAIWSAHVLTVTNSAITGNSRLERAFWLGVILAIGLATFSLIPLLGLQVLALMAASGCALSCWSDSSIANSPNAATSGTLSPFPLSGNRLRIAEAFAVATLCGAIGGLLVRHQQHMHPAGAYGDFAVAMAWLAGWGFGGTSKFGPRGNLRWSLWGLGVWGTLVLLMSGIAMEAHLWVNSNCSWPDVVLLFRAGPLFVVVVPVACIWAGMARGTSDTASKTSTGMMAIVALGASFGHASSATWLMPWCGIEFGLGLLAWLAGVGSLLVAAWRRWVFPVIPTPEIQPSLVTSGEPVPRETAIWTSTRKDWSIGSASYIVWNSGLLVMVASVVFHSTSVPEQSARLLFSSQAFFAYRNGIPREKIPFVDDSQHLRTVTSTSGTWTVWRQKESELHLRQSGLLRGTYSTNAQLSPQPTVDVTCTVLGMTLVEKPQTVLVLGGMNLASVGVCAAFPVQKIDCLESDAEALTAFREEVARRGGFDPFLDERMSCFPVSPDLGVHAQLPCRYDVVCSLPPQSSVREATGQFTVEFYLAVANQLSDQGVFCQRFTTVDYGPEPLRVIASSMAAAFRETAAIEVATNEFILLATNSPAGLVTTGFCDRLQKIQSRRVLGDANWDWSLLLNIPALDHAALREFSQETQAPLNTVADGRLPFWLPREVMSWEFKYSKTLAALGKPRTSEPVYEFLATDEERTSMKKQLAKADLTQLSRQAAVKPVQGRRSRLLEWIGEEGLDPDLNRRLSEVGSQYQLVRDYSDSYWWEYRKSLKKMLQSKPVSAIRPVSGSSADEQQLHPEYARRRDYLLALGNAKSGETPTLSEIDAVLDFVTPFDPLVSPYAPFEAAELHARRGKAGARDQLHCRLRAIYRAPVSDVSVVDILEAMKVIDEFPSETGTPRENFERLNALMTLLSQREANRAQRGWKSPALELRVANDVVKGVERAMQQLESFSSESGYAPREWRLRKEVLELTVVRMVRNQRDHLQFAVRDENAHREVLKRKFQGEN